MKYAVVSKLLLTAALLLGSRAAAAQSLPVSVGVAGNIATVQVGDPLNPLAELTLTFDDASGLSASSLGVSAKLVDITDPSLLARLPDLSLTRPDSSFPLLITIEPPATGGLSFHRSARVEVHTHALNYSVGSPYRLFKAPLGGAFRDITDEVAPGSVRARGTTGGFSQFLVLTDLRETGNVIAGKLAWLRARVDALPATEQPPFDAQLDAVEVAVAGGDFATAIDALDAFRARAAARAGKGLTDEWRATRDADNQAGELLAGAATLKFSIAYLRDYGQ
ncbi:MAG: DUF6689 family protein [Luteimonas sp.]